MSRTCSADMAEVVTPRLVRRLDDAAGDAVRDDVPFPPRVELAPHSPLRETSGMHWA